MRVTISRVVASPPRVTPPNSKCAPSPSVTTISSRPSRAPRDQREQRAPPARADLDAQAPQVELARAVQHHALAEALARRDLDVAPAVECAQIDARQRMHVGVAPGLVAAGGEEDGLAHAAAITAS